MVAYKNLLSRKIRSGFILGAARCSSACLRQQGRHGSVDLFRQVMAEGKPIRDVSAGKLGSNTSFLRAERNLLQNHGWTLNGDTCIRHK
jgi:hypothetical protein